MYKNPFEQLDNSRTILLAYAAQLKGGKAERVMCEPDVLGSFLEVIANSIEEALEAYDEAPLNKAAEQSAYFATVHEPAPSYK